MQEFNVMSKKFLASAFTQHGGPGFKRVLIFFQISGIDLPGVAALAHTSYMILVFRERWISFFSDCVVQDHIGRKM